MKRPKVIISFAVTNTVTGAVTIACAGLFVFSAAEFEGKRWRLPPRLLARPLELLHGAPYIHHDLKIELKALRLSVYVDTVKRARAGCFYRSSRATDSSLAGFHFPMSMGIYYFSQTTYFLISVVITLSRFVQLESSSPA